MSTSRALAQTSRSPDSGGSRCTIPTPRTILMSHTVRSKSVRYVGLRRLAVVRGCRPPRCAGAGARAAATPAPDTVVATIDGQPVTEGDLGSPLRRFDQQFARSRPSSARAAARCRSSRSGCSRKAAEAAGLDKEPTFQPHSRSCEQRSLHSEYLRRRSSPRSPTTRSATATTRRSPIRRRSTKCMPVTSS